ncbi:hypothetical protein HHI36_000782 [Cryptolaemus montrouzieri]|uniref:Uncharacterized protein n=1 Tax=Cryptolaemus montrouzieri TaxID=559131 RepID=A0ABD2P5K2_9CUCU
MDGPSGIEFRSIAPNSMNDPFLNISSSDIDIGRESIPILDLSSSFGRESLGILKFGCDINSDIPRKNFNFSDITEASSNIFDQAFIISSSTTSDFKNLSPYSVKSSNFSFNVKDFDQPSVIRSDHSLGTYHLGSDNKLNNGFLYTSGLSGYQLSQYRSRFNSVPVYTSRKYDIDTEELIQQLMKRVSEGCQKMNTSILKEVSAEENGFNDSVFIEARHLTCTFSENGSKDGFILDETDPPELINGELEENKCDSKDIFKKIDTLLPADGYKKLNDKLDNRSSEFVSQNASPKYQAENCDSNAVEIKGYEQINKTDSCQQTNVSGKATTSNAEKSKKILKRLSQILAKDDLNEVDTEQGHTLLNTLSNMLGDKSRERSKSYSENSVSSCNGYREVNNDSGKCLNNSSQANLSGKAANDSTKRQSNSFSFSTKALKSKVISSLSFGRSSSFDSSKNKSSVIGNGSESSVEVKNFSVENATVNLKMKKISSAPRTRGPMKATVPVENFTKSRLKETPPRIQQKVPRMSSKISTPIREVQLRPVAQSTPDNKIADHSSSSAGQNNLRSLSSPNLQDKSSNYSNSVTSLSSYKDSSVSKDRSSIQQSFLPRRNSMSEGRRSSISSDFKRSNSMRESNLMKTMTKIRHNLSENPTKGVLRDCSNVSSKDGLSMSSKLNDTPRRLMRGVGGKENLSAA